MKVITEKALHKSKSGLVELDLHTDFGFSIYLRSTVI